jgi:hypothetical protein
MLFVFFSPKDEKNFWFFATLRTSATRDTDFKILP